MTIEEKLALLNSIQIEDYDTDSDALYTVTCEDSKENRNKIMQLGYTNEEVQLFVVEEGLIEMTHFAWKIASSAKLGDKFNGWFI